MFQLVWLSGIAVTALGITFDMHRLRTNRVGLRPTGWVVASVCAGPIAGIAYVIRRRTALATLVDAVWQLVGDATHPDTARRERLIALERSGLLGAPVFRACLARLAAEATDAAPMPDASLTNSTDEDWNE
ncbi:hypothetical protein G3O06_07125 [Burkholderia sp. Ac-20345]|uniref:hypothetical protein n=1 Tax=Burkholderia sp. Ac-20345 TaxID=2703891 RepID=UPI00197B59E8|nr:hypothetical protein [Burkholderia sp. Ac-20345]MBN3777330.1 hypothetical protein [Burkholderia sp. Ac-20345]